MLEHEYSVLGGVSRVNVGRYLSHVSAAVSAGVVYVVLRLVDIAKKFGLPATLPPSILSLLGAAAVFAVLYWVLDKYAWRWPIIKSYLNVPDLSGDWVCKGQTLGSDNKVTYEWEGTLTIVQTWDRLRIRLKTSQSGSNSNSAALTFDAADGYRLFYSYHNDPKIGEAELKSHRGFAEIVFAKDLSSGEGEYFNGYGRYTFGKLKLQRP